MDRQIGKISVLLVVGLLCLMTANAIKASGMYQADFRIYYRAAESWKRGESPYRISTPRLDGTLYTRESGYIYPPYASPLFAPFLHWEMPRAEQYYLALHVLAAALLLWVMRQFLGTLGDTWFVVFALLAFNGSLIRDIEAGNIAIFEQLLIWLGFWAFLRGRFAWFCLLVLAGSAMKFLPATLLVVLPMRRLRDRRAWIAAASVVAGAAICLGAAWIRQPILYAEFLHRAASMSSSDERGQINPALFPLVRDVFDILRQLGWKTPPLVAQLFYAAAAVAIICLSFRAWRRAQSNHHADLDRLAIVLACLAFALVMPRMKEYTYVLLLAPGYYIIRTSPSIGAVLPLLFLLAIAPVVPTLAAGFGTATELFHDYYSYGLALLLWIILCRRVGAAPAA